MGNYQQVGCSRGLLYGMTLAKIQPAGVVAPYIDSASVDLFSLCRWLRKLSVFPVCFLISSCFLVFNKYHLSFHLLLVKFLNCFSLLFKLKIQPVSGHYDGALTTFSKCSFAIVFRMFIAAIEKYSELYKTALNCKLFLSSHWLEAALHANQQNLQ